MDPVTMFERAGVGAAAVLDGVRPGDWHAPTPCSEWDVEALVAHLAGGPAHLLAAVGRTDVAPGTDADSYRRAVASCAAALREPGALDRRCVSPAGFEWSVAEAAAGTAMDQLVHTWDLATASGQDPALDAEVVEAIVTRFLPDMPVTGRAAGLVGDEVPVPADAPAQDRLLGAMGRRP